MNVFAFWPHHLFPSHFPFGNRSFRLRVVSPTVCLPTSRVDSPTSNMAVRLPLAYVLMLSLTQIYRRVNIPRSKNQVCVCENIPRSKNGAH